MCLRINSEKRLAANSNSSTKRIRKCSFITDDGSDRVTVKVHIVSPVCPKYFYPRICGHPPQLEQTTKSLMIGKYRHNMILDTFLCIVCDFSKFPKPNAFSINFFYISILTNKLDVSFYLLFIVTLIFMSMLI